MTEFIVCVNYYSRPEFPSQCGLIEHEEAVLRDILLCNPSNEYHIKPGMQYDPHIEYDEYRICSPKVRQGLSKRSDRYEDLYILFRTRYYRLDGTSAYYLTGLYRIKKDFSKEERNAPIILAEESHFVRLSDSIPIERRMRESGAYRAGFTSENENWEMYLRDWLDQLYSQPSFSSEYIEETNRLKEMFAEYEFTEDYYPTCRNCPHNAQNTHCPLIKRKRRYDIINNPPHYMENLDSFYEKYA